MAISRGIRTARLLITPFTEGHITARYLGWLNDKVLLRYSEQRHRHHTHESCLRYLRSFDDSPNYFWAIEEQQSGLGHIGNISAYVDENNQVADIGILIGESGAQQKGYGLEAWRAVCAFLIEELGMRKISAGTVTANAAMLTIMQRAGMTADGVRRRHRLLDSGLETDVVHMALFRTPAQVRSSPDEVKR